MPRLSRRLRSGKFCNKGHVVVKAEIMEDDSEVFESAWQASIMSCSALIESDCQLTQIPQSRWVFKQGIGNLLVVLMFHTGQ